MSQENVEIVRDQFGAANEGDFARVMGHWADDIEAVVPAASFFEGGAFKGKDAVGRFFGEWFRSFERGYQLNVEEARDFGGEVLVVARNDGRGRASGAAVGTQVAYLFRVRDGQIARIEVFPDRAAALEAVGLSE
jgi:ketosteroid isomerase-like protein